MAIENQPSSQRQVGFLAVLGMATRVTSQTMTLALLLLAGRFLSVELFGIFVLSSILMNFAVMQMYSGIYHYALREPGFEASKGTALSLQIIYGIASSLIILASAGLVYLVGWGKLLALLIAATSGVPMIAMLASWQEANVLRNGDVKYYYVSLVVSEIIGFSIGVWMLFAGFEIWSLIVSRYASAGVITTLFTAKCGIPRKLEWDSASVRRILDFSLALYGNSLLAFLSSYGAAIVIGGFLSATAVGLYRMGARTAGAAYDVFAHTFRTFTWQAVGRMAREENLSPLLWIRMIALTTSILTFTMGSLSILAGELTLVLLGPDWLGMVPVLQIICFVQVLSSVDLVAAAQLAAVGETRFLFRARLIQIGVLMCGLLVSVQFGMIAVALSLLPPVLIYLFIVMNKLVRLTGATWTDVFRLITPGLAVSTCALTCVFAMARALDGTSPLLSIPVIATIGLAVYSGIAFLPARRWTQSSLKAVSVAILPKA